ncbi:MAG: hypothetical protein HY929_02965 [Euryarchaeota archaeon]|nr:hypothetical protein [Euryarchaeota archaeon]
MFRIILFFLVISLFLSNLGLAQESIVPIYTVDVEIDEIGKVLINETWVFLNIGNKTFAPNILFQKRGNLLSTESTLELNISQTNEGFLLEFNPFHKPIFPKNFSIMKIAYIRDDLVFATNFTYLFRLDIGDSPLPIYNTDIKIKLPFNFQAGLIEPPPLSRLLEKNRQIISYFIRSLAPTGKFIIQIKYGKFRQMSLESIAKAEDSLKKANVSLIEIKELITKNNLTSLIQDFKTTNETFFRAKYILNESKILYQTEQYQDSLDSASSGYQLANIVIDRANAIKTTAFVLQQESTEKEIESLKEKLKNIEKTRNVMILLFVLVIFSAAVIVLVKRKGGD